MSRLVEKLIRILITNCISCENLMIEKELERKLERKKVQQYYKLLQN
jgi:hypothetical protein